LPRRPALLGALLSALAGCDDGWRPEEVVRLPPGLVEGATEPRRWALGEAAERLLDRPGRLAGQPAEAAFAAGLVEYLATAFQDGSHPDGRHVTRLLREGRAPLRAALGLRDDLPPQATADALLAAAAAGRRGDTVDAERALAAVGRPGARPWHALAALDPPGPLRRALRATRDMLLQASFPR
jgi:hypothetical protein